MNRISQHLEEKNHAEGKRVDVDIEFLDKIFPYTNDEWCTNMSDKISQMFIENALGIAKICTLSSALQANVIIFESAMLQQFKIRIKIKATVKDE